MSSSQGQDVDHVQRDIASPNSPNTPAFHDTRQNPDSPLSDEGDGTQVPSQASPNVARQEEQPAQSHSTSQDAAASSVSAESIPTDSSHGFRRHDSVTGHANSDHEKNPTPYDAPITSDSSTSSQLKPSTAGAADARDAHISNLDPSRVSQDLSRPPPLNYTLRTRKFAIAFFWSLIIVDSIGIPLILYFCLHYLTDLSPNAVFSISTGCLGGISIFEYVLRFWRLWKKGSNCRVLGARRWYLDWFHWNFSIAWIFIMVELIVGTVFPFPPIRVLAMPVASLLFWFAFELLAIDTLRFLKKPALLRISSVPKGAPLRPAIYSIIEDVVAVDGSGGTEFRKRLNTRYVASHYFRQMLHRLTIFWAFGSLFNAIVTTGLVFGLANNEIAYIIGWALPFVWAGAMVPPTFWYVGRCLKYEYAKWPERTGSV